MPLGKEEAEEALKTMVKLRDYLEKNHDPNKPLKSALDDLTMVFRSKLFKSLLELQEFYYTSMVGGDDNLRKSQISNLQGKVPLPTRESGLLDTRLLVLGATGSRTDLNVSHLDDQDGFEWDNMEETHKKVAAKQNKILEIDLVKDGQGLGITVAGGLCDVPKGESSIYITRIYPGSVADRDGRVKIGDKILSVNGKSFHNVTHEGAIQVLKSAPPQVKLFVMHDADMAEAIQSGSLQKGLPSKPLAAPSSPVSSTLSMNAAQPGPPVLVSGPTPSENSKKHEGGNIIILQIKKAPTDTLGLVLQARFDGEKEILFVKEIKPNSLAEKTGKLVAGDKVLELNGVSCVGMTSEMAAQYILANKTGIVTLKIWKHEISQSESLEDHKNSSSSAHVPFGVREVALVQGARGFGFNIVGPSHSGPSMNNEPTGIFISKLLPGGNAAESGKLREGDQILSINGTDVTYASYAEASKVIKSVLQEKLVLRVVQNAPVFEIFQKKISLLKQQLAKEIEVKRMTSTDTGKEKDIFVRALFNFQNSTESSDRKKLSFGFGEIILILDMSDPDWWRGQIVSTGAIGFIPSKKRREGLARAMSFDGLEEDSEAPKEGIRKRSKSIKMAQRMQKRRGSKQEEEDKIILSYQRVELGESKGTRPLLVMGPGKDLLTDQLITEMPSRFASCVPHTTRALRDGEINGQDYFFVARDEMEKGVKAGMFIEAGLYNGNLYGTSVQAVRDVASQGCHCILDISPQSIPKLFASELYPLIFFLKPASVSVVKFQNPEYKDDVARTIYESALKTDMELHYLCTSVIENKDLDDSYAKLKAAINENSRSPCWVVSSEPLP